MYRRHLIFLFGACLVNTGCATLTPPPIGDIFSVSGGQFDEESKDSEVATPPDGPSFVVEMRGANGESQKFTRPLTDEATYIQGVLVQSNAMKHFGRVKIQLFRPLPDGSGFHKIDIPYSRKMRSVPPAYDYAILEGDRLVFMKDESSILDDMLESIGKR